MTTVIVRNPLSGQQTGSVDLDPEIFDIEPNVAVMHQVVTAQLAARRRGTQSTLTRAEVKGGSAKPWRQKGTGRARHGSTRNPQWRGGGVALGPKPRSYRQRTPKKMVRLALCSALSDRAREDKVVVVDQWHFTTPRTKDAVAALETLQVQGRVLVVADVSQREVWKSFSNLSEVHTISPKELNAYDILVADSVIFSLDTLPTSVPTQQLNDEQQVPTEPQPTEAEAEEEALTQQPVATEAEAAEAAAEAEEETGSTDTSESHEAELHEADTEESSNSTKEDVA